MSLETKVAVHVANVEGPFDMISRFQSVYRKKSFIRREEFLRIVIGADKANKPMSE